jgi:pilus assembly protein FimV
LPLRDLGAVKPDQLRVRMAAQAAWQAAGIPYPVDVERHELSLGASNGEPVVLLRSPQGGHGDVLDLLIELQWPQGRLQREVGLLLKAAPGARAPFVSVPAAMLVQPGDTASALGLTHLDPSAPMPQALAALVQANPDAFVQGNVNRLRAGAVLKLPDARQIQSVDLDQARRWMAEQNEAFEAYRGELAAQAPTAAQDASPQVATGKIQPSPKQPEAVPTDRLTLSTAGADGTDQIAAQRQAQQTAERAAEINRNIQELNRIAQGGDQGGLPISAPAAQTPASETIDRWVRSPHTPWAALACVLLLAGWIAVRVFRGGPGAGSSATDNAQAQSTSALNVDFDLNLPHADSLPPLPASVHHAPTPVIKDTVAGSAPVKPWTEVTLDFAQASPPASDDPESVRLDLAQALWDRGLTQTALVLAREVAAGASASTAQRGSQWLAERA